MSNPVSTEVEHLSIFQYTRGHEYAGNRFNTSPRPERFKSYNGPCVRLKTTIRKGEAAHPQVAMNGIEWLKQLLLPAFGVTSVKFHGHESELLWSYPSAGGCYPVELYVHVRRLAGVEPGLYHYNALYASLYRIAGAQTAEQDGHALPDQEADVSFILTIVPWRTCWKYSHKGYRFGLIDAGHVAANLQLVLRSLGWQSDAYTRLRSEELAAMLKLDSYEVPIAMIAASCAEHREAERTEDAATKLSQRVQLSERCDSQDDVEAELFDWEPILGFQKKVNRTIQEPSEGWLTRAALPEDWTSCDRLLPLLIERRSSAAFQRCELPAEQLFTMVSFIERIGLHSDFHMIVNGIEGLAPGIYRSTEGRLDCAEEGDFRDITAGICLGQTFIRDCSAMFVFTVDMSHIPNDDFSLYQQCTIDGGAMGQLIHLKTEEMGLGFSIIGGFYDDEFRELLSLSSSHQIIYAGAWGLNALNGEEVRKDDRYVMNKPQS